ncbi:MAG: deoxyhypusine synthase family protein [Pseudomonadota bacterium]
MKEQKKFQIKKMASFDFDELSSEQKLQKQEILSKHIEALDLSKIKSIDDLVCSYGKTSIQARNIGTCADVYEKMLKDPDRPTIMLGLAGPLIAAGLRKVIRDMIANNMVDVVVSTGAILYQDLYQSQNFKHYVGSPTADDRVLRDLYIDRIYDTYVDEQKFWQLDCSVGAFTDSLKPQNYSSRQFLEILGWAIEDDQSILATAARKGVPIFAPALNDSSLGIGLTEHLHRCLKEKRESVSIDSIQDNYELTQIVVQSPATAAFYVAGGVPKNYINDSVVMAYIFDQDTGGHRYALQVTTDSPHWGGLSGSTLSEATSWGKVSKKATHSMAFVEPSVSLPLIVGAAMERMKGVKRTGIALEWDAPILKKIGSK